MIGHCEAQKAKQWLYYFSRFTDSSIKEGHSSIAFERGFSNPDFWLNNISKSQKYSNYEIQLPFNAFPHGVYLHELRI